MRDEGLQTAFVLEHFGLLVALVDQFDAHAGIEERQFAQSLGERVVVERDVREDLRARLEAQRRAFLVGIADGGQRRLGLAQPIFLTMQLAVAPDEQFQIIGERIDHRDADAMQTAGDLVGAVIELAAGVQHGHDDFGGGAPFFGVDVDRDAAAVVRHGHGFVGVNGDHHPVAMTRQGLVDGVIHNLEHHVMQAAAIVGIADVHSGPFSNRVESL